MNLRFLPLIVLVLCLAACLPAAGAETAPPKAVVVDCSLNGDTITVLGSRVVMTYPPDNRATDKIVISLLDRNGALLQKQGMDDPRVAYIEDGVVIRDRVNFSVAVPFRSSLATITLTNGTTGERLVSADVSAAVSGYCRANGSDPDCSPPPGGLLMIVAALVVVLIVAGAGFWMYRKKRAG